MLRKDGEIVVFEYAYREKDHVTIGEDGLRTLRLLLLIGRNEHRKFLKKIGKVKSGKVLNEWSKNLLFGDKVIHKLFRSAKKVIVEVDWEKWADIEKELTTEMQRLNK